MRSAQLYTSANVFIGIFAIANKPVTPCLFFVHWWEAYLEHLLAKVVYLPIKLLAPFLQTRLISMLKLVQFHWAHLMDVVLYLLTRFGFTHPSDTFEAYPYSHVFARNTSELPACATVCPAAFLMGWPLFS